VKRRARRVVATALAAAGCLAAPLTPVQAYEGQGGNDADPKRLAALRNATADYRDFALSQQDGFTALVATTDGRTCITNAAGNMGEHWANGARVGDGEIHQQRPEVLLYEPQPDGSKQLLGVEYVVIASDWLADHDSPPVLFGREFTFVTTNPYGLPPFYELHAWAWRDNPSGPFADWNPDVRC